ncbi:MAG: oligosaccharide flippase family protein [Roseburia sp.]|nr:oligosaccharide flippase family protein [Roseburia sp.]
MQLRKCLKNPIVTGTFLLTLAGLITKLIGFFYRIFLSRIFHEEGLGVIGLIAPVAVLVHSVCAGGLQNAITRFVAASKKEKSAESYAYLFTGIVISMLLSVLMSYTVFHHAAFIARKLIGEPRCVPLLQISALSFPLASLHCCINGFFYGRRQAAVPAVSMLIEQLVRVAVVYLLYAAFMELGARPSLSFACIGMLAGEFASAGFSCLVLLVKSRKSTGKQGSLFSLQKGRALFTMALPLSMNRICISLLSSIETIQLPKRLVAGGLTSANALSLYGIFSGMAFPLIMFPSALTGAAASLLLPTVSEAQAGGDDRKISRTIGLTIAICFLLGVLCMIFFLVFADFLGIFLFDSEDAASQIRSLAFVCPFLYLSGTLSSILHGLGKTGTTFVFNLLTILLRLGFVLFVVPAVGFSGYFYGILCSQIFLDLLIILALKQYIVYN